jgi:thiamine pyrophosphokinase
MKFLIISGGTVAKKELVMKYNELCDYVICVDKGLVCAHEDGITPNLILGDMDSVDQKILKKYHKDIVNIFPSDKDYTDTELAIRKTIKLKAKEVYILCATGTRLDHTLSNVKLLLTLKLNGISGAIIDDYNEIRLVDEYIKIDKQENQVVSLLPLGECYDVSAKGFLYTLDKEDIDLYWNIGISNVITSNYGEVSLKKGDLLVIISKESE